MLNLLFCFLFILGVYYLIRNQLNLKKAAEISHQALYPRTEAEFASVLLPPEWKEMESPSKRDKSYLYVKWGTIMALVLLTIVLGIVLFTNWLDSSIFSIAYFLFAIIRVVPNRGNLFVFSRGIILNGRYYSSGQIQNYEVEEIVRWHELYGLHDRLNYGFKLSLRVKSIIPFYNNYVVITNREQLNTITSLLNEQGIHGEEIPEKNADHSVN